MKKIIITIALLIIAPLSMNAQWEILNDGSIFWINTLHFVNRNVGWIAESNGTLLKTTDGGDSWVKISINENWSINQINFINESVGWAVGSICNPSACYAIIIKTDDGGFSWTIQKQIIDFYFNAIYIIDENNAFAIGSGKIFKTINGGTSWNDTSPNQVDRNYNSLWFQNPDTGVVVGNYYDAIRVRGIILKTTNGGSTWNQTFINEFNDISNLQFFDSKTGYFKASNDSINFLCRTEDLFSSWSVRAESRYGIGPYQFLDSNTVYAIIIDSIYHNYLMKSIDGSKTWQNVSSFDVPNIWLSNIYFWDTDTAFILGHMNGGYMLFRSNDNGFNWIIKKFSYPLNDLYFTDKNYGFIAGGVICDYFFHCRPDGRIIETKNGGLTWELKYSTGIGIQSCFFVNDIRIFILSGVDIYKSTNNGNNWNKIYENNIDSMGYGFRGNNISFLDENIGWAVGNYWNTDTSGAGILGTLDGGENWDLIWKYPNSNDFWYGLYSLSAVDTVCWAVGDYGMIVKYTSQTGWLKQTSVTDLPLKKVFFIDDEHGWISGGYNNENDFQSILLKTTNGGESWKDNKLDFLINDLWFLANKHGWAVGCDSADAGVILETKDGGDSWAVVVDNLIGPLNSIFIKDNYAWAVGDYGLILRTTDAGVTWVDDRYDEVYPTEFKLEQNYPNPFNPNTTIKYSIPNQRNVTLKVFDVLGSEVTTLVNKEQSQGNYKAEFDGYQLTSGIYFYRLQAGDYVETKKMILIK